MPDVFEEGQPAQDAAPEAAQPAPDSVIEELKDRGIDELAKGKAHADQFIEHLKEQNAQLKSELDTRLTAEATLEEIKTRQVTEVSSEPTSSGLNPEDVKSLVQESITQANAEQIASANVNEASEAVTKVYGEKGSEFVAGKAAELGLSVTELMQMASKSPQAFLTVVGVTGDVPVQSTGVTQSTVNQEMLGTTISQAKPGTDSFYKELRKSNPKKFYDPKIQQQLFKDRERLGQDYYN